MSTELNLDNLKKLMAHIDGDSPCDHIRCMYALVSACPLLIADVERLRQELATAKRIGAAEELERMAAKVGRRYALSAGQIADRAAELRAEVAACGAPATPKPTARAQKSA
jgi:hypothetical protein